MTATVVACRMCGAQGEEDGTDPCPGLCPPCMERLLIRIQQRTWAFVDLHPHCTREDAIVFLRSQLARSGFTPAAVEYQISHVRRALYEGVN